MKIKITLLSIVLLISSIVVGIVKAEDLKCKTMSNGVCTEYFQPETKCKTMVDGQCTEFYSQLNYNTGYQEPPKTDMRYLNKRETQQVCNNSFGFWYAVDDYAFSWTAMYGQAAKVYITHVEPNSPAQRAGLQIGDEITKINGTKITKFKGADFDNYLDSQQTINLEIRGKKDVSLSRTNMCKAQEVEPFFDPCEITAISANHILAKLVSCIAYNKLNNQGAKQ